MQPKLLPLKEVVEKESFDLLAPYARFIYTSSYIQEITRISSVTEALAALKRFADGLENFIKKIPHTHNEIFPEHPNNVALINLAIAQFMGLPLKSQLVAYFGGLIHDTGKIGVPDDILRKTDMLTPSNREKLNEHAERGYLIWKHIPIMLTAEALIALQHQEKFNGTGYPQRLSGNVTLLEARITQVSDSFDAMSSPRAYHENKLLKTPTEAFDEIQQYRNIFYDPEVVEKGFIPWFKAGQPKPQFDCISFYNRMLLELDESSPFYLEDIKQLIIRTHIGLAQVILFMCDKKNSTRGEDPLLSAFYAARFAEICGCTENEVEDAWYYGGLGGLYDNFLRDDVKNAPDRRPFAYDVTKQLYLPQPGFQGVLRVGEDIFEAYDGGGIPLGKNSEAINKVSLIARTALTYVAIGIEDIEDDGDIIPGLKSRSRGDNRILSPYYAELFLNNLS